MFGEDFDVYLRVGDVDECVVWVWGVDCVFVLKCMYANEGEGEGAAYEMYVEVVELSKGLCVKM